MANTDLINKIETLLDPKRKANEMERIKEALLELAKEVTKKKDKAS